MVLISTFSQLAFVPMLCDLHEAIDELVVFWQVPEALLILFLLVLQAQLHKSVPL